MRGGQRVEIGRLDLAIDPGLQAKPPALGLFERAVADAVHGVTGARQLAREMAADKSPCSCYPDGHHAALWAMKE